MTTHIAIASLEKLRYPAVHSAAKGGRDVALLVRLSRNERAALALVAREYAYEPTQLIRAMILDVTAGRVAPEEPDPRQLPLPLTKSSPRGERKSPRASAAKRSKVKKAPKRSRKTPTPHKRSARKAGAK